ncbi:MAG: aryl-sulfate sulfotransferase [Gammaproteobacteria bacterium]
MRRSIISTVGLIVATTGLLTGCESPPPTTADDGNDGGDNTPPVISNATLANANPRSPLAAMLTLTTDEPTRLTVRIDDGERVWDVAPDDELKTEHSAMVLGMRFGLSHAVTAITEDAAGNQSNADPITYETPPVPLELPTIRVTTRDPERMEPGVNLFNVKWWGDDGREKKLGLIVIMDDRGDIVWSYRNDDDAIDDIRQLSNGNILYTNSPAGEMWRLTEIDLLGNVVQRWHATGTPKEVMTGSTPVAIDSFHHEVIELPSGNFLGLSSELRVMDDFPSSDTDPDAAPERAAVVGDVVVEFARDGTVIRQFKLLDILDPHRIGYNSMLGGFYNSLYGDLTDAPLRDWSHSNALEYNPADDSVIMSLRHQDALAKIDLATGDLIWLLGTADNWNEPWSSKRLQPTGEIEWQYHQHGSSFSGTGSIMLFDNGLPRASAFQEQPAVEDRYSRAVEYAVDDEAMEVSQPWSYGGPGEDAFYSSYLSDVDWLPITGNILVTDGARETGPDGLPSDAPDRKRWARIFELTHTDPAEIVFEAILEEEPEYGLHIYRAKRLPSLYP